METPADTASTSKSDFFSRREALRDRVAAAAQALAERGITPTVARVRAALGGGSPNDLAPALKHWKEAVATVIRPGERPETPGIPVPIRDLAQELWQRATVAAAVQLRGGAAGQALNVRTEEAESLRQQITTLRNQLERESIMFGELRAQAARHEAVAREAWVRIDASEARERRHLRDLGSARERIGELEATLTQLRERPGGAARRSRTAKETTSQRPRRLKDAGRSRRPTKREAPQPTVRPRVRGRSTSSIKKRARATPRSRSRP